MDDWSSIYQLTTHIHPNEIIHQACVYFFLPNVKGSPMFLPRSLIPRARSILPRTCWLGVALPASYSLTYTTGCQSSSLPTFFTRTYNLGLFIDQLSQILLSHVFILTTLLKSFANRDINLGRGSNFVITIQLGNTTMVSVGMAGVGQSYQKLGQSLSTHTHTHLSISTYWTSFQC